MVENKKEVERRKENEEKTKTNHQQNRA